MVGHVRITNELDAGSYFEFQGVAADGRQRLIHRTTDAPTEVQVLAARGGYGGSCVAFGPGTDAASTTPTCGGLIGNIVVATGGLALSGFGVGGLHNVGTHQSFYFGTNNSHPANTNGFGAPNIIDLGTFSAVANTWGGMRPSFRYTALDHQFRVDGGSGENNPGTEALRIASSGRVGIGTPNPQSTLQVVGGYIQLPTITGPPPAADCDAASEAGRLVVRTTGMINLYICTGITGWRAVSTVSVP